MGLRSMGNSPSLPILPPCAWCDRDVMAYMASFNGKDICVDCEEDYLEEEESN